MTGYYMLISLLQYDKTLDCLYILKKITITLYGFLLFVFKQIKEYMG